MLIIDDEIASGGTLVEAVHFLQLHGVNKVSAAAVHPVLSGKVMDRIREVDIEELVVTDSIPLRDKQQEYDKFKVLSVAPLHEKRLCAFTTATLSASCFAKA